MKKVLKYFGYFMAGYFVLGFIGLLSMYVITDGKLPEKTKEELATDSVYHRKKQSEKAYYAFKRYIINNLRNPDSYDEISYQSTYNEYRDCYVVDIKYRAENGFGGMTIERYIADVNYQSFDDENPTFTSICQLQ